MLDVTRRRFLQTAALGMTANGALWAQFKGERPKPTEGVSVLNPRGRVPVSLIIDDSTCLVNLAHFCIPHFAEVYPDRYKQDWKKLPREIPDSFVREFAEWCHDQGVKGKYSCIPYPACVGWIDRDMPGWSKRDLLESLKVVREVITPDWDIHPEMVTHTWVINPKTGRAFDQRDENHLENFGWSQNKSADELTAYMAYALKAMHNVGLPVEGITTPGGFGNKNRDALARASFQACRDVYKAEIPHYFRHVFTSPEQSVAPRVEFAAGIDGDRPECVVSIIGCTGDWFGGWDGLTPGKVDQFISVDGKGGRLPEVIAKQEPAILVCHWPGIYFNGEKIGFNIFKEVVKRLKSHYDNLHWMKLSEISRYWAARELTAITRVDGNISFQAPYACPGFTVQLAGKAGQLKASANGRSTTLQSVPRPLDLRPGTFAIVGESTHACFDLPKGPSKLELVKG